MTFALRVEPLVRALLWQLPPELAHQTARWIINASPEWHQTFNPRLSVTLANSVLPHPIGLAAGFDKSALMLHGLARLGFAFVEAGTVTPLPQPGNAKPRLFRLAEDKALINRFGFNNDGLERFVRRLQKRPNNCMIGANIGINKTCSDPLADFALGLRSCSKVADYITINVSSPNTPGLRDLQEPEVLQQMLRHLNDASPMVTSIFLKLAPDLEDAQLLELVDVAISANLAGLILCNTTIARPETLRSAHKHELGGLSGLPIRARSREMLRLVAQKNQGRLQLISAGGLFDGRDLYDRLAAGAQAVQIYSGFIYQGAGCIGAMCEELLRLMDENGIEDVSALIGHDIRAS